MSEDRWADACRLEAWAGEVRVNLLRTVALIVFYGHHLINVWAGDPTLTPQYNATVTAVVFAWVLAVFVLHVCLSRRWVPPALKYFATFWDLALITALLIASPAGPRSPLIFLYFVVLAAAPLRLSVALVQVTTLAVWAAALLALGHYVFVRVGPDAYYAADSRTRIPRTSEVIFLLAVGAAGLFAGQVVRQARRLVHGYPVAVEEPREEVR
jgi:hypothetical protein